MLRKPGRGSTVLGADPTALVGVWSLERSLLDRRTGHTGSVIGTLEVGVLDRDTFRWYEAGEFTWGGVTRAATRSLRLRRIDGRWWCTFADGGLFHPWQPGLEVTHPCRADLYRGRIELPNREQMRMTWDVTGPAKDERYDTTFTRCSEAPPRSR
jgi:hypothetical protein